MGHRVRSLANAAWIFFSVSSLMACSGGSGGGGNNRQADSWLIPAAEVIDGGPGKDGIPAIDEPNFESASTIASVADDMLVIAVRYNGEVRAYPHDILDWHEIVNDGPRDDPFSISYCPLTGSAVAWVGDADASLRSFGVSGLLYNSNLILYDRKTDSRWSQMLQKAVWGPRSGEVPERIRLIEMKFATLRAMYPDAQVMNRNTGWNRNYDVYPYGFYRAHEGLHFPVSVVDNRLHLKKRVIGIHSDASSRVWQLDGFGDPTLVLNEQFEDQEIVVIGNSTSDFAAIYSRELGDGTILNFSALQDQLPVVMSDDEGGTWDVFGRAVSGPRAGEQLDMTRSYTAMWFAWAAFFQDAEIHFN